MGGGGVMRAAAKVAGLGVLNGAFRGGDKPVVSAARQTGRSIASVVSSSDDLKLSLASNDDHTNSSVEKPYDDWEFAGVEDEPMPRLVFGGAPSIQEAKQATYDLNDALEKTYLSQNSTNGQMLLVLSDSDHAETKSCLVSESMETPLVSKHAIQAFRLLHESPSAQNVVASIASDPNVWNAVLNNEALVGFLETHQTGVFLPEFDPKIDESPEENESKSASGKGFMDYIDDIKQKISVTVVDMMNSLSDTFQTLFGGAAKAEFSVNPDGTAAGISVEKNTIGATLMGLAIMVITVVVLKRA